MATLVAAVAVSLVAGGDAVAQLPPASCDPAVYGAFPDDGLDDTAGLQAAADTGCVVMRAGVYHVSRVAAKKASVVISKPGAMFIGAGARRTWIRMTGSGGGGEWPAIKVACATVTVSPGVLACSPTLTATGIELRDFGFDNSLPYNTDEQTHAIQVGPGATDVHLSDLYFWHPIRYRGDGTTEVGGDCIRVAGVEGRPVTDWSVRRVRADVCDRSFVAIQSPSAAGVIADNDVRGGTDNDVDGEITGAGDAVNIEVRRNVFRKGLPVPGSSNSAYSISFAAGSNAGTVRGLTIADNTLDRGIELFDVAGAQISNNVIHHAAPSLEATIEVRRSAAVALLDNKVVRSGAAGPVVRCFYHNGAGSKNVTIRGGVLRQETDANVVIAESCPAFETRDVELQYKGPPPPPGATGAAARYGVRTRSTFASWPMAGLRMTGLILYGGLTLPTWSAPPDIPAELSIRSQEAIAP